MEITAAKLQESGVLINGSVNLPDGSTGHVREAYNGWLAEGNTPDPADPPAQPTTAELIAELEALVTPRNLRGAALGDPYAIGHIQDIEDRIGALRG